MAEFSDARSGAYCMCTRERCSDECRTYRQFRPKPVTNADRIRTMSDAELAEWMFHYAEDFVSRYVDTYTMSKTFIQDALDWLKQEAAHE